MKPQSLTRDFAVALLGAALVVAQGMATSGYGAQPLAQTRAGSPSGHGLIGTGLLASLVRPAR